MKTPISNMLGCALALIVMALPAVLVAIGGAKVLVYVLLFPAIFLLGLTLACAAIDGGHRLYRKLRK